MSRRLIAGLAALSLSLTTAAVSLAVAEPAQAASCTKQSGSAKTDPDGNSWTTWWVCGNDAGARMYRDASTATLTGYMDTTSSWFVCWKRGASHTGGNNVWYYSQGDRSASGQSARKAWGYMPAVNVWTSVDPWTGMAECPSTTTPPTTTTPPAPSKPPRSDSAKPLVLMHGYDTDHTLNCKQYWGGSAADGWVKMYLEALGWFSSVEYVTFYSGGSACGTLLPQRQPQNDVIGTEDEPIDDIAANFAWWVYNKYSSHNVSIDVIAHSMGGLVTRAAISGTANRLTTTSGKTFPPYLYIEDVATLSSPHDGGKEGICLFGFDNLQCEQMDKDDTFMKKFIYKPSGSRVGYDNPQSGVGTDWSAIGSTGDGVIDDDTALDLIADYHFGHKYRYETLAIDHSNITNLHTGSFPIRYCHYTMSCSGSSMGTWTTGSQSDPIYVAALAAHRASAY